jgi:hypothetical protein
MNKIIAIITQMTPPTAPPIVGARDFGRCEAVGWEVVGTEVEMGTTVGGGVKVEMTVNVATLPLSSVDDTGLVTTVGEGVTVTKMVVGMKDVTDDGWEGLCEEGPVNELANCYWNWSYWN